MLIKITTFRKVHKIYDWLFNRCWHWLQNWIFSHRKKYWKLLKFSSRLLKYLLFWRYKAVFEDHSSSNLKIFNSISRLKRVWNSFPLDVRSMLWNSQNSLMYRLLGIQNEDFQLSVNSRALAKYRYYSLPFRSLVLLWAIVLHQQNFKVFS